MQECEAEAPKRALTRDELQTFFDHADDQVERDRGRGRKGWLHAFRDAMLFKTAYVFGLPRNETRMLDTAGFGRNPARSTSNSASATSPRQGEEGLAAQTPQRADGMGVVSRDPRPMDDRGPARHAARGRANPLAV